MASADAAVSRSPRCVSTATTRRRHRSITSSSSGCATSSGRVFRADVSRSRPTCGWWACRPTSRSISSGSPTAPARYTARKSSSRGRSALHALGARLERPEQTVEPLGLRRPHVRREQRHPPARPAEPLFRRADLLQVRRRLLDAELIHVDLARAPLGDEFPVVRGRQRCDERLQAVEQEVEPAGRRLPGDAPLAEPVQEAVARVQLAQAADLLRGGALPHAPSRPRRRPRAAARGRPGRAARRRAPAPTSATSRPAGSATRRSPGPRACADRTARWPTPPAGASRPTTPAPRWSGAPAPARPARPATRGPRRSSPRIAERAGRARSGAWTARPGPARRPCWRSRPARPARRSRGPARGPRWTGARRDSGARGRAPPGAIGRPPMRPAAARARPGAGARSRPPSAGPPRASSSLSPSSRSRPSARLRRSPGFRPSRSTRRSTSSCATAA